MVCYKYFDVGFTKHLLTFITENNTVSVIFYQNCQNNLIRGQYKRVNFVDTLVKKYKTC